MKMASLKHSELFQEIERNYKMMEDDNEKYYLDYINKWKDAMKNKILQYRMTIDTINMEKNEYKDFAETCIKRLEKENESLRRDKESILKKFNEELGERQEKIKTDVTRILTEQYEIQYKKLRIDKEDLQKQVNGLNEQKIMIEKDYKIHMDNVFL